MKPCRKCKTPVQRTDEKCLGCGEDYPAISNFSNTVTWIVILGVVILLFNYCAGVSKRSEAEERRLIEQGHHCLGIWNGAHTEFSDAVKARMRDPESFKHVETRVGPKRDDGTHAIVMTYRAANGFGAMVQGRAVGTFKNKSCAAKILQIE